jgi:hypothetical protein
MLKLFQTAEASFISSDDVEKFKSQLAIFGSYYYEKLIKL